MHPQQSSLCQLLVALIFQTTRPFILSDDAFSFFYNGNHEEEKLGNVNVLFYNFLKLNDALFSLRSIDGLYYPNFIVGFARTCVHATCNYFMSSWKVYGLRQRSARLVIIATPPSFKLPTLLRKRKNSQ